MPKNPNIKKVIVIGSCPIVIGQAAEFDYAGTQACRALKEEGIYVILINSNPATIMTDKNIADQVYIEPLTPEIVKKVIVQEKPDSILPTLGGQAALNIAMELEESGFLRQHNVRLIGTSAKTIKKAEDRDEFKKTMNEKPGFVRAMWCGSVECEDRIKADAFMTGVFALTSVGTFAFVLHMGGPEGGEALLPLFK